MEQRLKERLIGAAVLVALAVWLVPWLLDGSAPDAERDTAALELPVPADDADEAPVRTVTIDLDTQNADSAAAQPVPVPRATAAAEDDDAPAAEATPAAAAEPAVPLPEPEPEAPAPAPEPVFAAGDWVVQLGSFGDEANADRLAARVRTFGFESQVSTHTAGGRQMHRVRVGPHPTRERAEAAASALTAHGFVAQVMTTD